MDEERGLHSLRNAGARSLALVGAIAVFQAGIIAVHLAIGSGLSGTLLMIDRIWMYFASIAIIVVCVVTYFSVVVPAVRRGSASIEGLRASEAALERGERRIRALYLVASAPAADPETQIADALAIGARTYDMHYGYLARVTDGTVTIRNATGENSPFSPGFSMPLAHAIARRFYGTKRALAVHDLSAEAWAGDVAARRLPWKSFIGTTVFAGGRPYGTLTFMDTQVRSHPFDEPDLDFIDLMSTLVGSIVERETRQHELQAMAFHDALTGLANRALLEEHMERAIAQARRSGELLAVHFVDLDGFKPINDAYGHAAGDAVLREVAKRFSGAIREQDVIARVGGDEFVILQSGLADAALANALAGRLRASLLAKIAVSPAANVKVGASFGLALFPRDANDARGLLQAADARMYQAKQTARTARLHAIGPVRI